MLQDYVVLFRFPKQNPLHDPFIFLCQADDTEHAEEQCFDLYPSVSIVWIAQTKSCDEAFDEYYSQRLVGT